jgi:sarcosine oxidase subunit gamma
MAELCSALAGLAPGPDNAALSVRERSGLCLLTLRGAAYDPAFVKAVVDTFGAALPRAANTAARATAGTVLWLSPDAWLAVTEEAAQIEALAAAVRTTGGYALNASHARVAIRIEGTKARTALAQGCRLDLHSRAFAPDACAQSWVARIAVLLHRAAEDTFDLYAPRSYARAIWSWLLEIAADDSLYQCT